MKAVDIQVGECYRTETSTIRQVVSIEQGKVRYRSRGPRNVAGWTAVNAFQFQPLSYFAFDVVEQVPPDWEPPSSDRDAANPLPDAS